MFDKEAILNGTPRKRLIRKFDELKSNLTKQGAFEYFLLYSEMELSDIIGNFEIIYKEPYKGTNFIKDLVKHARMHPSAYENIADNVGAYLAEKRKDMSPAQFKLMDELAEEAIEKTHDYRAFSSVELLIDYGDCDCVELSPTQLFNARYRYDRSKDSDEKQASLDEMNEIILNSDIDMLVSILVACGDIKELCGSLTEYIKRLFKDKTSICGIARAVKAQFILSRLTRTNTLEKILKFQNDSLKLLIGEYGDGSTLQNIIKDIIAPQKMSIPAFSNIENAINDLYDDEIVSDLTKDEDSANKIEILEKEKAALSATSSMYLLDLFSCTPEELDDAYDEAIADLYTGKDEENIHIESADSGYERLICIIESRIDSIEEELALEYAANGEASDTIKGEIGDKQPVPKKPSQPLSRKIQTKALDANVKNKKFVQGMKKNAQELRNTGKAVAKVPENVKTAVDKQIKEWDDMDDERRKKYILEAGFRKKYYKALKTCLMYGMFFAINPILVVIGFIASHASKEKDLRIKNELAAELESEIRICEEKINDANSKGDNDKKYKLMRIKDKLQSELTRVNTNSKYI